MNKHGYAKYIGFCFVFSLVFIICVIKIYPPSNLLNYDLIIVVSFGSFELRY